MHEEVRRRHLQLVKQWQLLKVIWQLFDLVVPQFTGNETRKRTQLAMG